MEISGLPYMLEQIMMNTVHTNDKGLIIPKKLKFTVYSKGKQSTSVKQRIDSMPDFAQTVNFTTDQQAKQ